MYNLSQLMQGGMGYRPPMQPFRPGVGQFQQPQMPQMPQQMPGGYQPAQQQYMAAPAMAAQPPQNGAMPWSPGIGGYGGNPMQRPNFQPRMSLGSLMGRPNY